MECQSNQLLVLLLKSAPPLEARPLEDYFQPAASQLPFPSIRRVTKIDVASVHPAPRPGDRDRGQRIVR